MPVMLARHDGSGGIPGERSGDSFTWGSCFASLSWPWGSSQFRAGPEADILALSRAVSGACYELNFLGPTTTLCTSHVLAQGHAAAQ